LNKPVIAIVGLGKMGETIVHHVKKTNHKLAVAVEIDLAKGIRALDKAGIRYGFVASVEEAKRVIDQEMTVLTDNVDIIFELEDVNVIIDATGNINAGAYIAWRSINKKKNIVMLNAELDATLGPILSVMATSSGIIYTGDIGDEPGAIMYYLFKPLRELGLEIIVAGKGKNNPLNVYATPTDLEENSKRLELNPRVLTSFVDGTKTMVEMTILSNATGFLPDVRGMHGPTASLSDLTRIYRLKSDGGILNRLHVVEYVIGIAPGVFVIATTDDEVIEKNLQYLKVGEGPNFLFYRPYHLPGSETLLSAVRAVTKHEAVIQPIGYLSETVAVAKRDLNPGEKIDGIGGYTVYGIIEKAKVASEEGFLPIGLSEGAVLKKSVRKGQIITFDDVELKDNLVYDLWRLQRKVFK